LTNSTAWLRQALSTILPTHSLLTGKPDLSDEAELWGALEFIDAPCCDACGYPFEFEVGEGVLCGRCEAKHPAYDRARAAIRYNDESRKIVLDFKHGGRTDGLSFFAAQMSRAGRQILVHADVLIPVPLHSARLRKRRFNQAALLARSISKRAGVPYDTDALLRAKNTPSQGTQSFIGRKRNVAGAFLISRAKKPLIEGSRVVLIDDVQTTGSTLESCARTLKKAGAAQVDALTLMRVVRPISVPT